MSMMLPDDYSGEDLEQVVLSLDLWASQHDIEPHILAGIYLSRVILLLKDDAKTGKFLARHVWEQFDTFEQDGNPDFD